MKDQPEYLEINWDSRTVKLEYLLINADLNQAPLIVFLHEGLGSLSLWREFPTRLCQAVGYRGLVYSRPGYGRSTPFDHDTFWGIDFMHRQAYEVLPKLLTELNNEADNNGIVLLGHSDGASIALLYGAANPNQIKGMITVAPHILVEKITIDSIRALEKHYRTSDLPQKLATHHQNPNVTFDGWSRVWLDHRFHSWSIEAELNEIKAPVLIVQGTHDEYGTVKQINGIKKRISNTETYWIQECGHSPHRTHTDKLINCSVAFIRNNCAN